MSTNQININIKPLMSLTLQALVPVFTLHKTQYPLLVKAMTEFIQIGHCTTEQLSEDYFIIGHDEDDEYWLYTKGTYFEAFVLQLLLKKHICNTDYLKDVSVFTASERLTRMWPITQAIQTAQRQINDEYGPRYYDLTIRKPGSIDPESKIMYTMFEINKIAAWLYAFAR